MFYNINDSVNNYCYVKIIYKSIMKESFHEELCTDSESLSDE